MTSTTTSSDAESTSIAGTADPQFDALSATVSGTVHLPGDPGFAALAMPWNAAIPVSPVAVLQAATAQDVAAAVQFAAGAGIQVAVQLTGHGAQPTGPVPTLLVHTGDLQELGIDGSGIARVGAGVIWSTVMAAAEQAGLTAPSGSAPGVGVVGLLTGGGHGPLVRTAGLSSDLVTAIDVVTGDGVLRRATPTENPDLFWGLRGGKGTLGIVTAIEFELLPFAEIFGGSVFFAERDVPAVAAAWRSWTQQLPTAATSSLAIVRMPEMPGLPPQLAGKLTVQLRFAWVGDEADGRAALAPMLDVAEPVLGGFGMLSGAAIGQVHMDPVDPMPAYDACAVLHSLPPEAMDALLSVSGPGVECPQVMVELRHVGDGVQQEPQHPSAFCQRDAAFTLALIGIGVPPVVDQVIAHGELVRTTMAPWSTGAMPPNFRATADPAELRRRWRLEVLQRLADVSRRYDPNGVLAEATPMRTAADDAAEGR
jgi:hypothetical protein